MSLLRMLLEESQMSNNTRLNLEAVDLMVPDFSLLDGIESMGINSTTLSQAGFLTHGRHMQLA